MPAPGRPDDHDLTTAALAAASGDTVALREFLRTAQGPVRRFCLHMVPDQDPDDLTQETFLRAWRSLPRFRGDSQAMTWLLSITRRVCIEAITRAARARTVPGGRGPGHQRDAFEIPDPASGGATAEAQALADLVNRLQPDRREAFVLTRLVGLSYAEAAQVAGCEVGTIRSRVSRARAELASGLAAPAADGGGGDPTASSGTSGAPPRTN